MELSVLVRDQEVSGSNPLAPTNSIWFSNLLHKSKVKERLCFNQALGLSTSVRVGNLTPVEVAQVGVRFV